MPYNYHFPLWVNLYRSHWCIFPSFCHHHPPYPTEEAAQPRRASTVPSPGASSSTWPCSSYCRAAPPASAAPEKQPSSPTSKNHKPDAPTLSPIRLRPSTFSADISGDVENSGVATSQQIGFCLCVRRSPRRRRPGVAVRLPRRTCAQSLRRRRGQRVYNPRRLKSARFGSEGEEAKWDEVGGY